MFDSPVFLHLGFGASPAENFHRFLHANRAALSLEGFEVADASGFSPADLPPRNSELRGVILTDPRFQGGDDGLMDGSFFPDAAARADALAGRLGRPVARLVVTVQPYEKLFRSAWRRAAMSRPVEAFAAYAGRMAATGTGWGETIEDVSRRLGAETTTVVAVAPSSRRMLNALVPGLSLPFPATHDPAASVTESAVAMAQRHFRMGARFAPGQAERLVAFHARQPQNPLPPDFTGLHAADLRGRFIGDMGMLARLRGMTVEGEAAPMPAMSRAIAAE